MKIIVLALLTIFSATHASAQPADVIVFGGKIYTMYEARPQVEAIAARNGRIVFVGSAADVESLRGPQTRSVDLQGNVLIPGLVDAHAHIMNLGDFLANVDLNGTTSVEAVHERVRRAAAEREPDVWIVGRGWDQNDWDVKEFPTAADLDDIPNPVYLERIDGHAGWVNRRALDVAGVTPSSQSPAGGRIIRDDRGAPTGVFIDNATELVERQIPDASAAEKARRVGRAIAECHRYGLVGVHEAGTDRDAFEIFTQLRDDGALDFRLHCMVDAYGDSVFAAERLAVGPEVDDYVSMRAIKVYVDGALGSRGAALLEPYTDDPGNTGLYRNDAASLRKWAERAVASGFQMCSHAIGDGGNHTALDVYAELIRERGLTDHRWRVEHAQVIALADLPRFARDGIIAAVQPTHCTSDMYWAEDRVGPERILGAYAWRQLLDSGAVLALGSDFPVESVNPLWGIYAAVSRQDHDGWPAGGWYPGERLTIYEAVRGFTVDAAYASFNEANTGMVDVGKFADFTVLDRDLFEIDPKLILSTRVMMTIVGGEVVYESSN